MLPLLVHRASTRRSGSEHVQRRTARWCRTEYFDSTSPASRRWARRSRKAGRKARVTRLKTVMFTGDGSRCADYQMVRLLGLHRPHPRFHRREAGNEPGRQRDAGRHHSKESRQNELFDRPERAPAPELNVTPLIDVLLVLLTMLILTPCPSSPRRRTSCCLVAAWSDASRVNIDTFDPGAVRSGIASASARGALGHRSAEPADRPAARPQDLARSSGAATRGRAGDGRRAARVQRKAVASTALDQSRWRARPRPPGKAGRAVDAPAEQR